MPNVLAHLQGKISDRANRSLRILDTLRWTGPTAPTLIPTTLGSPEDNV